MRATETTAWKALRVLRLLALRVISLPRSKPVGFGEEQTSHGSRNPQSRSRMTEGDIQRGRVESRAGSVDLYQQPTSMVVGYPELRRPRQMI